MLQALHRKDKSPWFCPFQSILTDMDLYSLFLSFLTLWLLHAQLCSGPLELLKIIVCSQACQLNMKTEKNLHPTSQWDWFAPQERCVSNATVLLLLERVRLWYVDLYFVIRALYFKSGQWFWGETSVPDRPLQQSLNLQTELFSDDI